MAQPSSAYATGAERQPDGLRQRAVPEYQSNGQLKYANQEKPDKKATPRKRNPVLAFLDDFEFVFAPIVFTFLAFFTRMYRIGLSNIVTWDEAQ